MHKQSSSGIANVVNNAEIEEVCKGIAKDGMEEHRFQRVGWPINKQPFSKDPIIRHPMHVQSTTKMNIQRLGENV
jgi:hypothetical protein